MSKHDEEPRTLSAEERSVIDHNRHRRIAAVRKLEQCFRYFDEFGIPEGGITLHIPRRHSKFGRIKASLDEFLGE